VRMVLLRVLLVMIILMMVVVVTRNLRTVTCWATLRNTVYLQAAPK
jgi:hypothetical protein